MVFGGTPRGVPCRESEVLFELAAFVSLLSIPLSLYSIHAPFGTMVVLRESEGSPEGCFCEFTQGNGLFFLCKMAEKLAASSSQRFGLISTLFARSIVFLGKRLNGLIFWREKGGREKKREPRSVLGFSVWGVRGHGIGYPRPYLFPGEGLSSSQTFVT